MSKEDECTNKLKLNKNCYYGTITVSLEDLVDYIRYLSINLLGKKNLNKAKFGYTFTNLNKLSDINK